MPRKAKPGQASTQRQLPKVASDLMGPSEVAKLAGVTDSRVRAWRRTAGLPYIVLAGRHFYFRKDVLAWLEQHAGELSRMEKSGRLPPNVKPPSDRR